MSAADCRTLSRIWAWRWGARGAPKETILFAPSGGSPLFRIPASGGQATEVTRLESPRQTSHRFPEFLPGGRQFLYYVTGVEDHQGIYVGSLDAKETPKQISVPIQHRGERHQDGVKYGDVGAHPPLVDSVICEVSARQQKKVVADRKSV